MEEGTTGRGKGVMGTRFLPISSSVSVGKVISLSGSQFFSTPKREIISSLTVILSLIFSESK